MAGRDGPGKTTFLEVLLLLLGSGNQQLIINSNVTPFSMNLTQSQALFNTIWKPLSFKLANKKDIKINAHHSSLE